MTEEAWGALMRDHGFIEGRMVGFALAFGIIGWAEAIRGNESVRACPDCLKSASGWTTGMPRHPKDTDRQRVLAPYESICNDCYDKRMADFDRQHPYR